MSTTPSDNSVDVENNSDSAFDINEHIGNSRCKQDKCSR